MLFVCVYDFEGGSSALLNPIMYYFESQMRTRLRFVRTELKPHPHEQQQQQRVRGVLGNSKCLTRAAAGQGFNQMHRASERVMEAEVRDHHEWQIPQGSSGWLPWLVERSDAERPERSGWRWHDTDPMGRVPRQPGGAAADFRERVRLRVIPYIWSIARTGLVYAYNGSLTRMFACTPHMKWLTQEPAWRGSLVTVTVYHHNPILVSRRLVLHRADDFIRLTGCGTCCSLQSTSLNNPFSRCLWWCYVACLKFAEDHVTLT